MKNRHSHQTVRHAQSHILNDQEALALKAKLGFVQRTKVGHPRVVGRA